MVWGQTGEGSGRQTDTVIALFPGNDFDPLGLPGGHRVIANKLHQSVIGIGTRGSQEDPGILDGRHRRQFVRQFNGRRVGLATEHVAEAQLLHLATGRLNDFLVAVTQGCAPQTRHTLQILLARIVVDIRPFTPGHDHDLGRFGIGGGINHRGHVTPLN